MSYYDYVLSREIKTGGANFNAILMALMRKADSINTEKLKQEWPDVWEELNARYNAPGGVLEGETFPGVEDGS
jgi:hypothetical protein